MLFITRWIGKYRVPLCIHVEISTAVTKPQVSGKPIALFRFISCGFLSQKKKWTLLPRNISLPSQLIFLKKKNNNNNICTKWFWMDLVNKPFFRFDALSKVFIVDTTLKTNAGISYSDVFSNFTVFVCFKPFYTCLIKFVAWLPGNSAGRRRFGLLK